MCRRIVNQILKREDWKDVVNMLEYADLTVASEAYPTVRQQNEQDERDQELIWEADCEGARVAREKAVEASPQLRTPTEPRARKDAGLAKGERNGARHGKEADV